MLDVSPAQPWRAETRPCPSKAAASEGNVEGLNDARTPLSDCFSILLDDAKILRTSPSIPLTSLYALGKRGETVDHFDWEIR